MNSFQIKTKVAFGTNSLQVLKEIKNKNVWIICDRFLADGEGASRINRTIRCIQ